MHRNPQQTCDEKKACINLLSLTISASTVLHIGHLLSMAKYHPHCLEKSNEPRHRAAPLPTNSRPKPSFDFRIAPEVVSRPRLQQRRLPRQHPPPIFVGQIIPPEHMEDAVHDQKPQFVNGRPA